MIPWAPWHCGWGLLDGLWIQRLGNPCLTLDVDRILWLRDTVHVCGLVRQWTHGRQTMGSAGKYFQRVFVNKAIIPKRYFHHTRSMSTRWCNEISVEEAGALVTSERAGWLRDMDVVDEAGWVGFWTGRNGLKYAGPLNRRWDENQHACLLYNTPLGPYVVGNAMFRGERAHICK